MSKKQESEEQVIIKKPPIRFFMPVLRTLTAVIPMLILSAISGLIMTFFSDKVPSFVIYIVPLLLYFVTQYFFLRPYIVYCPSIRRLLCTNALAYLILFLFSQAVLIGGILIFGDSIGNTVYTWLFAPLKLLYYIGIMGKLLSSLAICAACFGFAMLMPCFPSFDQIDDDEDD